MVKRVTERAVIKNSHGGIGSIEVHKIINMDDQIEGLSLFAKVIVQPHSTIGYHQHLNDAEAYYILEGEGIFLDHNKDQIPVKSGDLCLIKKGQSHGLENPNDTKIVLVAIVY